jgi:hypothetical protein
LTSTRQTRQHLPNAIFEEKRCQNGDKITYFQGLANLANLASSWICQNSLFGKYERITRRANMRQTVLQGLTRLVDIHQTILRGLVRLADICQMPFLKKMWLAQVLRESANLALLAIA